MYWYSSLAKSTEIDINFYVLVLQVITATC